jgi:hypothetical protein
LGEIKGGEAVSVKWIEHKGKRILYVDFRGLEEKEMIQTLDALAKEIAGSRGELLVLNNFEGTRATAGFMSRAKQTGKDKVGTKVAKSAAVGITGVKEVLLVAYNKFTGRNLMSFKTEAQALDWLAKD